MRSTIAHQWVPLIGHAYARQLSVIKLFISISLVALGFLWAIAIGLALGIGNGTVPLILILILLPGAAVILGLTMLFRFGQKISRDLRDAGVDVREACFARSKSEVLSWSARNRVELSVVAKVGDEKYHA